MESSREESWTGNALGYYWSEDEDFSIREVGSAYCNERSEASYWEKGIVDGGSVGWSDVSDTSNSHKSVLPFNTVFERIDNNLWPVTNGTWLITSETNGEYTCDGSVMDPIYHDFTSRTCTTFEVDNMVIKQTAPPEDPVVLKWDGLNPVSIPVTLEDGLNLDGSTTVQVTICPISRVGDSWTSTAVLIRTGVNNNGTTTLEWAGEKTDLNGVPTGETAPPGIYAYYVEASHYEKAWHAEYDATGVLTAYRVDEGYLNNEDTDGTCTSYSRPRGPSNIYMISDVNLTGVAVQPDGTYKLDCTYQLYGGRIYLPSQGIDVPGDASKCKLTVYGPDLQEVTGTVVTPSTLETAAGTTFGGALHNASVTFQPTLYGNYFVVISAADSRAQVEREHRNKPALTNSTFWNHAEILEPEGTIGGTVAVRVRVRFPENCNPNYAPNINEREVTDLHDCPWTGLGSERTVESEQTTAGVTTIIYKWTWDTTRVHNGDHVLRLYAPYVSTEKTVTVKNLIITNVKTKLNLGYLLYNPDTFSPDNTITYDLEDAVAADTDVTVEIFDSEQTLIRSETVTTTVGSNKTYVWDGHDTSGKLMQPGVYLYRISASQSVHCMSPVEHDHNDVDQDKSSLQITSVTFDQVAYDETTDTVTARVGFEVPTSSSAQLVSVGLTVYGPDLTCIANSSLPDPQSTGAPITFPDLDVVLGKGGKYVFLVSAVDVGASTDKAHRNRPLLQHNFFGDRSRRVYRIYVDPGHHYTTGNVGTSGTSERFLWTPNAQGLTSFRHQEGGVACAACEPHVALEIYNGFYMAQRSPYASVSTLRGLLKNYTHSKRVSGMPVDWLDSVWTYEVLESRQNENGPSLSNRMNEVNVRHKEKPINLVISLHCEGNASSVPGCFALYCEQNPAGQTAAQCIINSYWSWDASWADVTPRQLLGDPPPPALHNMSYWQLFGMSLRGNGVFECFGGHLWIGKLTPPSVIVEMAALTTTSEEALICGYTPLGAMNDFRASVAYSLHMGIDSYIYQKYIATNP